MFVFLALLAASFYSSQSPATGVAPWPTSNASRIPISPVITELTIWMCFLLENSKTFHIARGHPGCCFSCVVALDRLLVSSHLFFFHLKYTCFFSFAEVQPESQRKWQKCQNRKKKKKAFFPLKNEWTQGMITQGKKNHDFFFLNLFSSYSVSVKGLKANHMKNSIIFHINDLGNPPNGNQW